MISFGGTFEPCAYVTLTSIGRLGTEENKVNSNLIMQEIEKLGVASTRCYIYFQDVKPFEVGFNKTTFAEILK